MNNDINGFHHLGIVSRNMEAAVSRYERLGFRFTPLSVPRIPLGPGTVPEPIGAGNRCAIFRDSYFEILAVIDSDRWNSITPEQRGPFDLDEPLGRYEGLHVLHLGTEDLERVRARLIRDGLHPSDIHAFQRLVDTPDGPRMMRARTLSFPRGTNPEALLQIAQHETPELVLQPRYMEHPNGAISIKEVIVCVHEPDEVSRRYGTYTNRPVQRLGHARVIEFGQSRIVVVPPDHLDQVLPGHSAPVVPFLAGLTVSSPLHITRRLLEERAIAFKMHENRILVPAKDGYGAAVLFENAASDS